MGTAKGTACKPKNGKIQDYLVEIFELCSWDDDNIGDDKKGQWR